MTTNLDTISLRVRVFNHTSTTLYCVAHRANHKLDDGSVAQVLEPGEEGNYRLASGGEDIEDSVTYGNAPNDPQTGSQPTAKIELKSFVPFLPGNNKFSQNPPPTDPAAIYTAAQAGNYTDQYHPVIEWFIKTTH